jgi:UDP-glucose 4-epimerase
VRVVVVGATGNVGTALLRALLREPAVTSVVGIARRLPDTGQEPYSSVEWHSFDIARPDPVADATVTTGDRLTEVFRGADAVVHLAWLIQPNRDRDLMRRANVGGTRRVALAAAAAGVPHLVAASSWAAYSPADDDVPRDESWPTHGIRRSHYSVDKAAQERVLDQVERDHPDVVVSRLRTALIFQEGAGAEIVRFFIGPYVPLSLLRPGVLPVMPVPAGLRLHVVHANDAANAYLRVVLQKAPGPFNIAARDILWPQDLADILDHGRVLTLPPGLLRPPMALAWNLRLLAADPGWLDMGMGVPVMDTTRARQVLGWNETHSAADTLREMLMGIVELEGEASPALRPDDRRLRRPRRLPSSR